VTAEERLQLTHETRDRLPPVVARIAAQLGVAPKTIKVAHQTSRWGSCSTRGQLRFSWRMATLPDPVFDYIVLHELAHLKEMNHGPRFWAIVAAHCPEHKAHRRWLRTLAL
jgi:predicted metal-dependent hydrolase